MEGLLKKEKDFVVPGDKLLDSMDYLPGKNCYREGTAIFSKKVGIISISNRVISVIPLNSKYIPKVGDMVIGEVEDIQANGWVININGPHPAFLPLSGVKEFIDTSKTSLSRIYAMGDLLYLKVITVNMDSTHLVMDDPRCRKFRGGRIISINPAKVSRVIGREGSMINVIKEKTNTKISVGQNGYIWLEGEKEDLTVEAIKIIEKESHKSELTDKIAKFLSKK